MPRTRGLREFRSTETHLRLWATDFRWSVRIRLEFHPQSRILQVEARKFPVPIAHLEKPNITDSERDHQPPSRCLRKPEISRRYATLRFNIIRGCYVANNWVSHSSSRSAAARTQSVRRIERDDGWDLAPRYGFLTVDYSGAHKEEQEDFPDQVQGSMQHPLVHPRGQGLRQG
jgi:hypothetical protein